MKEVLDLPPHASAAEGGGAELTIFTGRFGSGKTEVALNYARAVASAARLDGRNPGSGALRPAGDESSAPGAQSSVTDHRLALQPSYRVMLVDLDIVTPYFRSRDAGPVERMRDGGVEVIAPAIVGQHLDTPAITPQILGAIEQMDRLVVLDVGGDPQGARALGQFSAAIRQRGYTMHFVVNPYRPFTQSLDEVTRSIYEIEHSARLEVTSLVSNPNLIGETTVDQIITGHSRIEAFARELHLPIAFLCIERRWAAEFRLTPSGVSPLAQGFFAQPILTLDRHFLMLWE
jgi:hypothetical protein